MCWMPHVQIFTHLPVDKAVANAYWCRSCSGGLHEISASTQVSLSEEPIDLLHYPILRIFHRSMEAAHMYGLWEDLQHELL